LLACIAVSDTETDDAQVAQDQWRKLGIGSLAALARVVARRCARAVG
jgi:hypothetical protein